MSKAKFIVTFVIGVFLGVLGGGGVMAVFDQSGINKCRSDCKNKQREAEEEIEKLES